VDIINPLISLSIRQHDCVRHGHTDSRIGKHRALSGEVMYNFRLYFEIGQTSVKPS